LSDLHVRVGCQCLSEPEISKQIYGSIAGLSWPYRLNGKGQSGVSPHSIAYYLPSMSRAVISRKEFIGSIAVVLLADLALTALWAYFIRFSRVQAGAALRR